MARRRPRRVSIALPGEKQGRRSFLKRGIVGTALLAAGGGSWLATRKTRPADDVGGALSIFSPEEAAVLLAIADRLVPERPGFPRPRQLRLAVKMDAVAAMADPVTQGELRQLVRLFESALSGFLLDGQAQLFTAAPPDRQDRRLEAWGHSRIALRRTGFKALKRLVYASYYASPETWSAVGYPGPPIRPGAVDRVRPTAADAPTEAGPAERQRPARRRAHAIAKPFADEPVDPAKPFADEPVGPALPVVVPKVNGDG
jgi:Gluconate 2-dehydrogenase subunit 3